MRGRNCLGKIKIVKSRHGTLIVMMDGFICCPIFSMSWWLTSRQRQLNGYLRTNGIEPEINYFQWRFTQRTGTELNFAFQTLLHKWCPKRCLLLLAISLPEVSITSCFVASDSPFVFTLSSNEYTATTALNRIAKIKNCRREFISISLTAWVVVINPKRWTGGALLPQDTDQLMTSPVQVLSFILFPSVGSSRRRRSGGWWLWHDLLTCRSSDKTSKKWSGSN